MRKNIGQVIQQHVEEHGSLYLFTIVLFVMGIIFGTLTVQSLGYSQQNDLFAYFQQFISEAQGGEALVEPSYALTQNLFHYLKYVGLIWILGLSIIGLPVVLVLVFLKGVFVGFTVGFLVHQMGWDGFWFALVAVIPQNLIVVPLILVMGVLSISFSLKLIGHLFGTKGKFRKPSVTKYVWAMFVASVILFFVAIYQTYISPLLMGLII